MNRISIQSKLVSTYDLSPVEIPDTDANPLLFRVEIMLDLEKGDYFPIVFRFEDFRLTPSFHADIQPGESDETTLIRDECFAWEEHRGSDEDVVLERVSKTLNKQLFDGDQ